MRPTTTTTRCAGLLLALVPFAAVRAGFANTHAVVAFADDASANLESLRPYSAAASQAHQLKLAESRGEPCVHALIVSAPSFSHGDVALLPGDSTIKHNLERGAEALNLPYIQGPSVENLKLMIERRFAHCGSKTRFRRAGEYKNLHSGSRQAWLGDLDRLVQNNLNDMPSPRIVLISSVADLGSHYRRKRQISDDEWETLQGYVDESDMTEGSVGVDAPFASPYGGEQEASSIDRKPASSVFAPGNNAPAGNGSTVDSHLGLFHRYTFTSQALVFSSLIFLLVLIPAALMSINALTSIELVKGLEHKMQGGQVSESKKDQ